LRLPDAVHTKLLEAIGQLDSELTSLGLANEAKHIVRNRFCLGWRAHRSKIGPVSRYSTCIMLSEPPTRATVALFHPSNHAYLLSLSKDREAASAELLDERDQWPVRIWQMAVILTLGHERETLADEDAKLYGCDFLTTIKSDVSLYAYDCKYGYKVMARSITRVVLEERGLLK
jgi:hypothetical protein